VSAFPVLFAICLSACAGSPGTGVPPPAWVQNPESVYPGERFIAVTGRGADRRVAEITALAGSGDGYEAVFTEATATGSAGTLAASAAGTKTVKVKFEVKNGGPGLWFSEGIVSTQDDSYLVFDRNDFAGDFTIGITVPANDQYLNIRWFAEDFFKRYTYLKARLNFDFDSSKTITLDYNGPRKVAVKNLYDVRIDDRSIDGHNTELAADWVDAKERADED